MIAIVKLGKNIPGNKKMTKEDKAYFEEVEGIQMFHGDEDGNEYVIFEYTNKDHFARYVERVNGTVYSDGSKSKLSKFVEFGVGNTNDRIADAFKMVDFLLLAVCDIYKNLSATAKSNINSDISKTLENILTLRKNQGEFFNIDLKESFESEIEKMINREKDVVDIINKIKDEEE